ncbi:MAG: class I SAM-dependent methyltransferase [Proteobacteria bacterium]|nr:class I SAM-dependent methyltransferase [Pseudomonadota bacterium]MBU1741205.1 class I SAM-dependent methyltransferase [Pseudomonadota bacterium]
MIYDDQFNPWAHYHHEVEPYIQRAKNQVPEMTCHKQAAEILAPLISPGDTLLDVGCGTGYTYWSFRSRGMEVEYHGLDVTPRFIDLGREHFCPRAGLPPERLRLGAAETVTGQYDVVLCVNTLYCLPNYHQPVERLCAATRKALFIRTLMDERAEYRYLVTDYPGMDPERRHMRAYYNIYPLAEVISAIEGYGFKVRRIKDERTGDQDEFVKGKRYPWRCLLAVRE